MASAHRTSVKLGMVCSTSWEFDSIRRLLFCCKSWQLIQIIHVCVYQTLYDKIQNKVYRFLSK